MSESIIISPPESPTLFRLVPIKEEIVNNAGELMTRQIVQSFPITIQGNVMYWVRHKTVGQEIRPVTTEEVNDFLELAGEE